MARNRVKTLIAQRRALFLQCYGEIFDRTLRERVAPAPFSFLQPGMTPEEEKIASQQNEWYSKMDIQAIMKAGRSLGEGGGVGQHPLASRTSFFHRANTLLNQSQALKKLGK